MLCFVVVDGAVVDVAFGKGQGDHPIILPGAVKVGVQHVVLEEFVAERINILLQIQDDAKDIAPEVDGFLVVVVVEVDGDELGGDGLEKKEGEENDFEWVHMILIKIKLKKAPT